MKPADVVLIGGGHTHAQVLRRWITAPERPGRGDDYALQELEIHAARLARGPARTMGSDGQSGSIARRAR